MKFERLNISDAALKMEEWRADSEKYLAEELDENLMQLRNELITKYNHNQKQFTKAYDFDYIFGMYLYLTLQKKGFTSRDAADDGIWRYLSLCMIPDIVSARWGKNADIRYYKQSSRIWLKSIWWYIHLSWQGSAEETVKVIKNNTTDHIMQLVDRAGSKGYFTGTYRIIMRKFNNARNLEPKLGEADFRHVMILHTAMCKTIEPSFCDGGEEGYVDLLFDKLGVKLI